MNARTLSLLLCAALLIRMVTLNTPDLTDPSEARFANAAVHMLTTGDWITPRIFVAGKEWIPYLAKPPFHIWTTALSFSLFGASTWAARIPALVAVMVTILFLSLFVGEWNQREDYRSLALYSALPSVLLFCVASITDPSLMAAQCVVMVSLYLHGVRPAERRWGYLFFVGAAIGFLIKGPIILIVTALVSGAFMVWQRSLALVRGLPWVSGCFLFLLIALPWYLLAERVNPGFIRYFFLQENFGRYLFKNFGNKFGSAHRKPYGTIWLYLFAVLLPWSLAVFTLYSHKTRAAVVTKIRASREVQFLICWALTPPLFFTFARQILPTYIFSSIPPGILVIGALIPCSLFDRIWVRASVSCMTLVMVVLLFFGGSVSDKNSAREVAEYLRAHGGKSAESCMDLGVLYKAPQSLVFYARDLPLRLSVVENEGALGTATSSCILLSKKDARRLGNGLDRSKLPEIHEFRNWYLLKNNQRG